jgi:hypothetical protein
MINLNTIAHDSLDEAVKYDLEKIGWGPLMDLIDRSDADETTKIIQYVAIAQLNYRLPVGDEAWDRVTKIVGHPGALALSFLLGFCSGNPPEQQWRQLLVPRIVQGFRCQAPGR